MRNLVLILLLLLIGVSCRTKKESLTPPVVLNNFDSTTVKTIYEQTPAGSSWLYAYFRCDSNNKVIMSLLNSGSTTGLQNTTTFYDGKLVSHTLKPADSISHQLIVRVISRSFPVPQPYPVYIEKELSKWQSFQLILGRIFMVIIGAALLFGGFKLYKKFV